MRHIPSEQFLRQLKGFEGFSAAPYICPAGRVTIGYGCNLEAHPELIPWAEVRTPVKQGLLSGHPLMVALKKRGLRVTTAQAEAWLLRHVRAIHTDLLRRCAPYAELLARGETVRAEALLDMAYTMGVGRGPAKDRKGTGLLGFTTFLPRMERGEYAAAARGLESTRWWRQVGRRARSIAEQIRTGRYREVPGGEK